MRFRAGMLIGISLVALASRARDARAEPDANLDVTWQAPRECPTSIELERRVAERVPADVKVRARGRVDRRGARYRVVLDVETASSHGERAIEAPSCDALASSSAVVIAMSAAREEPPAPTPGPPAPPDREETPAPALAPVVETPPAPAERPSPLPANDRARVLVRGHAVVTSGVLPSAAFGGGIAAGVVVVRALTLEAHGEIWGSQDGTVASAPGRGASFDLFAMGARACWSVVRAVDLAPCLGFGVARLAAHGFGASRVADATSVLAGPELALTARFPLAGPLALRAGVTGTLPITRQSFVINAAGTVHRPAALALGGFFGPEVLF